MNLPNWKYTKLIDFVHRVTFTFIHLLYRLATGMHAQKTLSQCPPGPWWETSGSPTRGCNKVQKHSSTGGRADRVQASLKPSLAAAPWRPNTEQLTQERFTANCMCMWHSARRYTVISPSSHTKWWGTHLLIYIPELNATLSHHN